MRTPRISERSLTLRVAAAAMTAALLAAPAWAQDAAAQKPETAPVPTSTIEMGVGGVTDDCYKAGEYNGLQDKGALALANIALRDRTPYTSANAARWFVKTRDLGLETRGAVGDFR